MSRAMGAGARLTLAMWAWLCGDDELDGLTVFDAPPVRAGLPHAVIEEPVLQAWDLAGMTGRIGTVAVQLFDDGERPTRARDHLAIIEDDLQRMPVDLGAGWRLAAMSLARSRLARGKSGWLGRTEWVVRMYRADS